MRNIVAGIFFASFLISSVMTDDDISCDVRARTETGWVCGLRRWSEYGKVYATFRGVPYAKQPVGELRFKELQPLEPWEQHYDARDEGPVCPQHDEIYGYFTTQEYGMSEACIHANIHVPLYALPNVEKDNEKDDDKYRKKEDKENISEDEKTLQNYVVYDEKVAEALLNKNKKRDEGNLQEESNYKYNTDDKQEPMYYSSLLPIHKKEGNIYDLSKYEQEYQKNMDDIWNWLKRTNKNDYSKDELKQNNKKYDTNYDEDQAKGKKTGGEDETEYYWPNQHKHFAGGRLQFILDTWPKFQRKNNKESLYSLSTQRSKRYVDKEKEEKNSKYEKKLLPILVLIHGGGFNSGSGDADLYGPEYLVSKDVIVITFNYRIGLFGFLSLNTSSVPGNNGLRDQITLLRWVQRNAKHFGGDPDNVTLMGHSTGSACAHLLSLSDATKGLFRRVILQSGTAYQGFYTTSPIYSATVTASFLAIIGIVSVNPEEIHQELVKMPLKRIIEANILIQAQFGLITFSPVVESRFPGVTTVIDKEPETLIAEGRGKEYPFIVGCTTAEAETFRRRLGYERYLSRVVANPRMLLPPGITFSTLPKVSLALGKKVEKRCFRDKPDLDGVVRCYGEAAFIYQAFRLARERAQMDSAPTFIYQFSYESDFNLVQEALKLSYKGTAHIEDLNYVFRANSLLEPKSDFPPKNRDAMMKDWMSSFIVNFVYCSDPTCNKQDRKSGWPKVTKDILLYEDIDTPYVYNVRKPTHELNDTITFFDEIYRLSGEPSFIGTELLD